VRTNTFKCILEKFEYYLQSHFKAVILFPTQYSTLDNNMLINED